MVKISKKFRNVILIIFGVMLIPYITFAIDKIFFTKKYNSLNIF